MSKNLKNLKTYESFHKEKEQYENIDEAFLGLFKNMEDKIKSAEKIMDEKKKHPIYNQKKTQFDKYHELYKKAMKACGGDEKKCQGEDKKNVDIFKGIVSMINNNGNLNYKVDEVSGKVSQTSAYGTENTSAAKRS